MDPLPTPLVIVSPETARELLNQCEARCDETPTAAADIDDMLQVSYLGMPVLVSMETATRWKTLAEKNTR